MSRCKKGPPRQGGGGPLPRLLLTPGRSSSGRPCRALTDDRTRPAPDTVDRRRLAVAFGGHPPRVERSRQGRSMGTKGRLYCGPFCLLVRDEDGLGGWQGRRAALPKRPHPFQGPAEQRDENARLEPPLPESHDANRISSEGPHPRGGQRAFSPQATPMEFAWLP